MSEFYVNESSLDLAAQRLAALAGEVPSAKTYARSHLSMGLGDTGILLSTVMLTTNQARDAVNDTLQSIKQHLDAASAEVAASAASYRATDSATEATLDATY